MKREIRPGIPLAVIDGLQRFGDYLRIARVKRGLTVEAMAGALDIHRSTYSKMEIGDPTVAFGLYANAMFLLGFGTPFERLIDPRHDETGLLLDLRRLPRRVRSAQTSRRQQPLFDTYRANRPIETSEKILKIGVVGAMSGPYGLWGLVSKHAAQATASMYNDRGGVEIDGEFYRIQVIAVDDRLDPSTTVAALEHLVEREGVRYVIGPNVDQTLASAAPTAERNGAMLFPYSFTRSYYSPPFQNTVLAQAAGFQAWPYIYRYLLRERRIRTVAIVSTNSTEGRMQEREAAAAAKHVGLKVVTATARYRPGLQDFVPCVGAIVSCKPDLIILPNLAPGDAPYIIRTMRELGFNGLLATEAAQDLKVLLEGAGDATDGLLILGGASTPEIRSEYMDRFVQRYCELAGGWNDEAGTKAYALEFILATIKKAGADALKDVEYFKRVMPQFVMQDPFVNSNSDLRYVGSENLRQTRQMGVPMLIKMIDKGRFETLLTASVG